MKGSCIIHRPEAPIEYRSFTGIVVSDYWNDIVDGLLEIVPNFDHWITQEGGLEICIAYCNQDGTQMGLEANHQATAVWHYLCAQKQPSLATRVPIICGPVVIIFGDTDFLEAL